MLPSVIGGPGGCLLAISERHRRAGRPGGDKGDRGMTLVVVA
jgi:hypothetical protein